MRSPFNKCCLIFSRPLQPLYALPGPVRYGFAAEDNELDKSVWVLLHLKPT